MGYDKKLSTWGIVFDFPSWTKENRLVIQGWLLDSRNEGRTRSYYEGWHMGVSSKT